jgi:uncharacterized membrane protein YjfL (UPF0719 family)
MGEIMKYLQIENAFAFFDPQAGLYLGLSIVLLFLAKWAFNLRSSFDINHELHQKDNKAVALSFTGYFLGIGYILWSLLHQESQAGLYSDLLAMTIWSAIGICLLLIAQYINDKLLFSTFCNTKELIEDRNVGTGAVEFGSFIGSAMLISSALSGEDASSFLTSLVLVVLYFVFGQLSFILFGFIYQKTTSYDLHAEIEKDNVAAGLSFGLSLVAFAILISSYINKYDSLAGLLLWTIFSGLLLLGSRFIVDKLILPGANLDQEITRDQNWGASLLEGATATIIALIVASIL